MRYAVEMTPKELRALADEKEKNMKNYILKENIYIFDNLSGDVDGCILNEKQFVKEAVERLTNNGDDLMVFAKDTKLSIDEFSSDTTYRILNDDNEELFELFNVEILKKFLKKLN